jgi:tetratricopeptide (TPR) repeat protein
VTQLPIESDRPARRLQCLAGAVVFVGTLGVYAWTLCPTVPSGDSGELIAAAHVWGVAHPPGYPLFTMLAALADRLLPWGEPAWRINLLTAACGAVAATLVYVLTLRITGTMASAIFAAAVYGLAGVVWTYASVAEVFALNSALCAGMALAFGAMLDVPDGSGLGRRALIAGVLTGLALSNHHTSIFVALAFAVTAGIETGARRLVWRWWRSVLAYGAFGLLIGLTPYVYIPAATAADPAVAWGAGNTWSGFFHHLTRGDYGSLRLVSSDLAATDLAWYAHLRMFAAHVWRDSIGIGPIFALIGLLALRRARVRLVVLALATTAGVFLLMINAPLTPEVMRGVVARFYILPMVFIAVLAGAGLQLVLQRVRNATWQLALAGGTVSATVAALLMANFHLADQRGNAVTRDLGLNILRGLPANALLFSRTDLITNAVRYAQLVLGESPDVLVLDQELLTYRWYCDAQRRRNPTLTLPGERYDGRTVFNIDLIDANLEKRPIYFFGFKEESFRKRYTDELHGLVRHIAPLASAASHAELFESNERLIAAMDLRSVRPGYAPTSFEREAMGHYADFFFNLAWLADQAQDFARSAALYQQALHLSPQDWRIARNFGVLLADRLHKPAEAADMLQRSLDLNPSVADRATVRQKIAYHRAEAAAGP